MKKQSVILLFVLFFLVLTSRTVFAQRQPILKNSPTPAVVTPTGVMPTSSLNPSPTPVAGGVTPMPTQPPAPTATPVPEKEITPTPTPPSDFGSFSPTDIPLQTVFFIAPTRVPTITPTPALAFIAPQTNIKKMVENFNDRVLGPGTFVTHVLPASVYGDSRFKLAMNLFTLALAGVFLLFGIKLVHEKNNDGIRRQFSLRGFFRGTAHI